MTTKTKKTSQIIEEIVASCAEDGTMTVKEFLEQLGQRAQAIAVLVFALSAVVAGAIPGFSTITAIPIMFIGIQMVLGRSSVFLPKRVRNKEVSPRVIRGSLSRAVPVLRTIEKFTRPRLLWLTNNYSEKLIALMIVVLACVLALPIPGGNFLPSITISLLSLSLIERDGFLLIFVLALLSLTGGLMIELITQAWQYSYWLWVSTF